MTETHKVIPIFFSFDNNYVEPAAVSFYSLLQKAKQNVFYEMYILHQNIKEEKQKLLQNVVKRFNNAHLNFIDTSDFLQNIWENKNFGKNKIKKLFTSETLLRCFPSKFFPQYNRIIYSDVDCVFVDDISELIDINLENKYIGAVRNAFIKWAPYELSHLKQDHYDKLKDTYFAGGILVFNLDQIRKDDLDTKIIEIINDDTIVKRWPDQDIMNIACDNKVEYLPLNYISYPYLLERIIRKDFTSHFTREELYDSLINPKIIHYAGPKPWNGKPENSQIWWAIFNYLDLPKTKIFKIDDTIEQKYRKYKKLYNIFLGISVLMFVVALSAIVLLIK